MIVNHVCTHRARAPPGNCACAHRSNF